MEGRKDKERSVLKIYNDTDNMFHRADAFAITVRKSAILFKNAF